MGIELSPEKRKQFCCYIDLLASVLNNTQPKEVPQNFNWKFFCKHAQRNSILNILSYAIDKLTCKPDETIIKVADNDRNFCILKETSQLVSVETVLKEFEKAGIKNLPLKGYFMKHLYPQSDFRTMTDVDILVRKKDFKKIRSIFLDCGFEQPQILKTDEIHFSKDLTYFEVQSNLNMGTDKYYDDIWSKAQPRENYEFSYFLTDEDFYIYMVYHCAKHIKAGGLGIRMLMDLYMFLTSKNNLDFSYIETAFKKLKLVEFEKSLRRTALNWFSEEETEISMLGEFVLYCSTLGNFDILFYQDQKRTKGNYWLKQFFIPYSKMKSKYSYVQKCPVLLPVSWFQYWFTRLVVHRDVRVKEGIKERKGTISTEDKFFIDKLVKELNIQ